MRSFESRRLELTGQKASAAAATLVDRYFRKPFNAHLEDAIGSQRGRPFGPATTETKQDQQKVYDQGKLLQEQDMTFGSPFVAEARPREKRPERIFYRFFPKNKLEDEEKNWDEEKIWNDESEWDDKKKWPRSGSWNQIEAEDKSSSPEKSSARRNYDYDYHEAPAEVPEDPVYQGPPYPVQQPLLSRYYAPLVGAFGGHYHHGGCGCGRKDGGGNEELLALAGIGALLFFQFMPMGKKKRRKRSEQKDQITSVASG